MATDAERRSDEARGPARVTRVRRRWVLVRRAMERGWLVLPADERGGGRWPRTREPRTREPRTREPRTRERRAARALAPAG
jgi:hypothetical protein